MTILHICSLNKDQANGVTVIVPQYLKEQAKTNTVLMLNLDSDGFNCEDYPVYHGSGHLQTIIEENQIDLVVFHEIYYFKYISASKLLKEKCIPYVIVPHCSLCKNAQAQKRLPKVILNVLFFRKFVKDAARVQYLSEKEKVDSSSFRCNSFISPNGVYLSKKQWMPKKREQFKLVYIGRYAIFHKGLDYLIDACTSIRKEMEQYHIILELYGTDFEGNQQFLMERIQKNHMEHLIHMNPPVFGDEKISILLDADAFIQTSRFEGQPVAILEAMTIGLVPIVTKGTTFMEVVKENNCGYSAGEDKDDIAKAILTAYQEREQMSQMSKNAVKLIEEHYEWSIVTNRLIAQYSKIIKSENDLET